MRARQSVRREAMRTICVALSGLAALTAAAAAADSSGKPPRYSWQEKHARVLPTGNLEWAPRPFAFEKGASVRYIDFAGGDDTKDGKSPQTAWKHHPWDSQAAGEAKSCTGVHTYVFKRGVVYRGALKAKSSGLPGDPIRLTSDPAWGEGEAMLYGSTRIEGGWKKAGADEGHGVGDPGKAWYIDLGMDYDPDGKLAEMGTSAKFSAMWQISGDKVERLHIAREPNYDLSDPDNPVKNWPTWSAFNKKSATLTSPALKGLGDKNLLGGATIWTESSFLMAAASKTAPKNYNPDAGTVQIKSRADFRRIPRAKVHFMIENVAKFLDAPGEFFFTQSGPNAGRLYLIPAGGVDPNQAVYEVAQKRFPIWIQDQHDIVVSGLEFRYNDPEDGTYDWPPQVGCSPCVRIVGNCANITVKNCRFYHVANAVVGFPRPENQGGPYGVYSKEIGEFVNDFMDNISITDNDVRHAERGMAILLNGASQRSQGAAFGRLGRVEVLRNRVVDTGFRHGRHANSSIPAISVVMCETCEIAGNIVDTSFGNGIFTLGGKGTGSHNVVPLTRMLVHDNQIDNTMLGCNDYGGLEHFQGGPVYIYNNVTRNCVGNRTLGRELGYSLYLDGGFKCYCFNNIIAGKVKPEDPDYYNHCGYFMVFGFLDQLFNNTIYHFDKALDGSSGNRSNILGNLMLDCHLTFMGQNRPGDVSMLGGGDTGAMGRTGIPTMAYASNVFYGRPKGSGKGEPDAFGYVGGTRSSGSKGAPVHAGNTLEELRAKLEAEQCRLATIGWHVDAMPLVDPANRDYRLRPDSAAAERGVKYFVPWALARCVGEWNFYKSEASPTVVLGEHFYMTDELVERGEYYFVPRQDLTVSACDAQDYVAGSLEDWIEGALVFDGSRTAVLTHAEMTKDVSYPGGKKGGGRTYDGGGRETLDMGTNSFLVEICFRAAETTTKGLLAGKQAAAGYALAIGEDGALALTLLAGDAKAAVHSQAKVNDGQWHHVLVEVDRAAEKASFYVDGASSGVAKLDGLGKDASLANDADFVVGRDFKGAVDFLRVCRSTLAESKTSFDELYAWEFAGPHLRDFAGRGPSGKRDAGALEKLD